ncbi:MAG: hypothetical protein Kow0027_25690 [Saprospiraceae bacterium]
MNKYFTIILAFASLLTSCSSNKTDLEKFNLKGKIWKVTKTVYEGEERFGKYKIGEKRYYGHQLYIFNEKGNLLESQQLDRKGKIETVTKYSYDKKGNCTEITTYENNRVKQRQVNLISDNLIVEVHFFDDNGELTEKRQYNYSGSEISGGKIFDGEGNLELTFQNEMSEGLLTKQILGLLRYDNQQFRQKFQRPAQMPATKL